MAEKISSGMQDRQADSLVDDFDGGALEIRTGAQPADANAADAGTLLVSITLPTPAFGASSSGTASKSGTWSGTAGNTGTAAHFRMKNAANTRRVDGSVTATGGGGEIELSSTSITSGQTVTINSFAVTQPGS